MRDLLEPRCEVDFRGEKRSNATHASTTDPAAWLYKKSTGTGAMLCFIAHALMRIPMHPVGCSDNIRSVIPGYPVS